MRLDDLQGKVVWAEVAKQAADTNKCGFGTNAWLFVRYPNNRPYLDSFAAVEDVDHTEVPDASQADITDGIPMDEDSFWSDCTVTQLVVVSFNHKVTNDYSVTITMHTCMCNKCATS